MRGFLRAGGCFLLSALIVGPARPAGAANAPLAADWFTRIRPDHPRMFFTAETFPAVKAYAAGPEVATTDRIRRTVASIPLEPDAAACEKGPNRLYGPYAQMSALLWRLTGDETALAKAKNYLHAGVAFYNRCSSARRAVNWYSASRVCALTAYDWIHDQLTPAERASIARGFFKHYRDCLAGKPFHRQNRSDHKTGFYGPTNMAWYIGLAFHGDGIDDAQAARLLKRGYAEHVKLLDYRRRAVGDDGGMGTVAAGYAFGMYPWSEFNFMHTYNSATGLRIERSFDHMSLLGNWVSWNCLPGRRRFGMGDSSPGGDFADGFLDMHMLQVAHFYAERYPRRARLAMWVREHLLQSRPHDIYWWPAAPLLVTRCAQLPAPAGPDDTWPLARNFEVMGVVFMKGGRGADAVQAMFVAGGEVNQHRHYDQGHFAIVSGDHLTGNSGHYGGRSRNGHLTEYFYRTAAANSLLIRADAKADRPPKVWGGPAKTLDGGQHSFAGRQIAFETCDRYSYAAVDMTDCYFAGKCRQAVRQFVFVHPDTFVIFDRVTSTRGQYAKSWLLHSVEKPAIGPGGRSFRLQREGGDLVGATLLPEKTRVVTVGGEGREFFSAGANWPQGGKARIEAGAWRLEISPAEPRQTDLFLHVLRAGGKGVDFAGPVRRVGSGGRAGAAFTASDGSKTTVLFNTRGAVGGLVRIDGDEAFRRPLTTAVQPQVGLAAAGE